MARLFSSSQLRAARGLLNWSRPDLAERTGVSAQTIHRLENDMGEPEVSTEKKIFCVLDDNGMEFTDNQGVRFKSRNVEVYEGPEAFRRFMDDIYQVTKMKGTEVCISGVEEKYFIDHLGKDFSNLHVSRMTALKGIKVRCLIREGDSDVYCESYNLYRWVPDHLFSSVPFYVYGDKFAVVTFEKGSVTVVAIESKPVAKAYRKQFEIIWKDSKVVKFNKRK